MSVSNSFTNGVATDATTINANFTDIAAELTNSVSVDGQSTLTGQLKAASGTVSAPGVTFGSDTNSGIYRIGSDNLGMSLGGSKVVDYATTGVAVTGTLSCTGAFTGSTTITANTGFSPDADDGAYLGQSGTAFSDLFLASGGVINWNAGNATLTHSASLLTSNVALSLGTSNALTAGTVELGHASDTTLARASAGRVTVEGSNVLMASDVASQANQEAASSTSVLVTPGRQHFHPGSAKAWVNFDLSGTATIDLDYGVASITDNGSGDTTITYDTAFSTADYVFEGSAGHNSDDSAYTMHSNDATTFIAASLRVITSIANEGATAFQNSAYNGVVFLGDH